MTDSEKLEWRAAFMKRAGINVQSFKGLFDALPDVLFHIVDKDERMVAMNPPCLENCNAKRELDIIGERIADYFPPLLADVFIARDHEVLKSGKPIVNRLYSHRADRVVSLRAMNVWPLFDNRNRIIGTAAAYTNVATHESLPDWYGRIKDVIAYIDTHFAEDLPVKTLAQIAHLSETRFRRLFESVMDITPGRYLVTIRLNAARRLLATTDRLIADIATDVGFWDQSHLVKAFKRERGETPSQFRKRHWSTGKSGNALGQNGE